MILHSLRAQNWRCLLNPVELGPFSEGLNVIHAPNGTGKSSLFEAMRRALFDAHHVLGREVEEIRPWGRELAPRVQVEFSEGGTRYKVEKVFLDSPSAHLFRFENGKFQPLAESRNAETRLREIFAAAEAPGRGLSRQEHWGLAQVLWAPQGSLQLQSLSASVTENLRTALGAQVSGAGGTRLESLVQEHYETYYTASGKVRTGKQAAPILALQEELDKTTPLHAQLIEQQQQFEEAARAVEDTGRIREQNRRDAEGVAQHLTTGRQQAELWQKLQHELQQKRLAEQAAKERAERLGQTAEMIRKSRDEIASLEETIAGGEKRLAELGIELSAAANHAESARRTRDDARRNTSSLDQLRADMDDARNYLSDLQARQTLSTRVEKLIKLERTIKEQKEQRFKLIAPTDKAIRELRNLLIQREKAQAALEASLIHLTIEPENVVLVRNESEATPRSVAAGQPITYSGSARVQLSIEGFGTIRASGPEGSAESHRKIVAESAARIAELTRPFGSSDPDRLQALRQEADELEQRIQQLETQCLGLPEEQTLDGLRQQLGKLDALLKDRLSRFPAWEETPPVASDLQAAYEARRKIVQDATGRAEEFFETAQSRWQGLDKSHAKLADGIKNAKMNLEAASKRLVDLTKEGLSDEARDKDRSEALLAWEASREQAKACETQLKEIPGEPLKTVQKLEAQHKALERAEQQAREQEIKAEAKLHALAAEGTYSKLAACEEKLSDLRDRLQKEKVQMDAARLLYETFVSCKSAMLAAVAAPVETAATGMLSRIAGPRLGAVRLNNTFVPSAIQPDISDEQVDITNLSGGEQEQLFLVTRLALGEVLARKERQLVVLDDVLNATDTARLARLLTLLEEASERLQIVILTCHPERYRALEAAKFFDLHPLC